MFIVSLRYNVGISGKASCKTNHKEAEVMKKKLIIFIVVALMVVSSVTLLRCGGGTPSDLEPQGGSNWDEMVWDQGNWG